MKQKTESRLKLKQDIISLLQELLIPEAKKLLGGTKSKIKKDENGKNIPYLEITEVVLVHFNVVNNSYQQNSRVLYTFVRSIIRYFICKFYVFKNI